MTLQEFQDYVQVLYMGNTDTPDEGADSWNYRLGLLKAAINTWETEEGVQWDELWVLNSDASDGDKTTNGTDSVYDAPTDFKRAGGYVYLTGADNQRIWYGYIKPTDVQVKLIQSSSEKYFWVTGNKKIGFSINLSDVPESGMSIEYAYYKDAYNPTLASHAFEMYDPWYAVHFALSYVNSNAENADKSNVEMSLAAQKLKSMKFRNAASPAGQIQRVNDPQSDVSLASFGR